MNNVITKDNFIEIINRMRDIEDFELQLYQLYMSQNCDVSVPMFPSLAGELIHTLNVMFGLDDEDSYETDIEYFCFTLDFGRSWEPGMYKINGEDIDLSDAGKLYDWLVKDFEDGDENAAEDKE